jgi:hypothetical protein
MEFDLYVRRSRRRGGLFIDIKAGAGNLEFVELFKKLKKKIHFFVLEIKITGLPKLLRMS